MTAFRRYRDIVIVVLLLAVPFFFLRASIRRPSELTPIDQAVLRVAAPLEYISSALARGVSSQKDVLEALQELEAAKAERAAGVAALGMVGGGAAGSGYVLRSPLAGTVTARRATIGHLVDTEEILFDIVDKTRQAYEATRTREPLLGPRGPRASD